MTPIIFGAISPRDIMGFADSAVLGADLTVAP
jgi:hypothetical protein